MTDRLKALSDAGVSIWLDDLSRERIETGNLAELVDEQHVVGVTTNPTIFASALADGERLRRAGRASSPPRAPTSTRRSSRSPPTTSATPATCCADVYDAHRRRRRPGLHRGRPPAWPTTPTATIADGQGAVADGRPAEPVHQDPGDHARAARRSPTAIAEGISVNVTLIFGLDRYRAVMDAYLDRPRAGQGERHRPLEDPLGRVVLRLPRRHRDRQAARRDRRPDEAAGADAARPAIANARLAYEAYEEVFAGDRFAGARGRRRQHAAAAVGLDRREGPGLPRHDVRHRPRRRRHRQHDAGEDDGGLRRPRRGRRRPGHRPTTPRRSRSWTTWPSVGIDYDDVIEVARGRGRREVREVVGRAASRPSSGQLEKARTQQ